MGALPNYQQPEKTKRKQPPRPKKGDPAAKCKPRTRDEVLADVGRGTNFDSGVGYLILFHDNLMNIARLTSGNVCTLLLLRMFQALSRNGKGSAALAPDTSDLSVLDCALFCRCDERTINRTLGYLEARGMVTIARLADSRFVCNLRYREWSAIELSYEAWDEARRLAEASEAAEDLQSEEDSDSPAEVKPGIVPITTKPHVVKAGHPDRESKVPCGVRSFQVQWEHAGLDLKYQAVVDSGKFILTACIAEFKSLESKQHAKRAESTTSEPTSGRGCPNGEKIPPNAGIANTPQTGGLRTTTVEVHHPRAAELSALFDPLLLRSCGKSLSGDPKMLLAACEAIGEADHEYTVKCVVDRSARDLKVSHVKALCAEIAANWRKLQSLPPGSIPKKLPTREEIDAICERERKELAEARRRRKA